MTDKDSTRLSYAAALVGAVGLGFFLGKRASAFPKAAPAAPAIPSASELRTQFATSTDMLSKQGKKQFSSLPAFLKAPAYGMSQAPPVVDPPSPFKYVGVDPDLVNGTYSLLISCVTPRPIAMITSKDAQGRLNAAPFSYFNAVNGTPPFITVGFTHSASGRMKHTLDNILQTGEFVVNVVTQDNVQKMNHTCGNFDKGVNEIKQSGLTTIDSVKVSIPRIAESPVQMECALVKAQHIMADSSVANPGEEKEEQGRITGTVIIAVIKMFHVAECVYDEETKTVDAAKLKPVGRLGHGIYGSPCAMFPLPRPQGNGLKDGENLFTPQQEWLKEE